MSSETIRPILRPRPASLTSGPNRAPEKVACIRSGIVAFSDRDLQYVFWYNGSTSKSLRPRWLRVERRRSNRAALLALTALRFAARILTLRMVNWRRMRFERKVVLAFFLSTFVALFVVSNASSALLFQDRHAGANGEETIYRFEAKAASTASPIEQSKAVKLATAWAAQYYGIGNLTVANAQERSMPFHFWLIAFSAPQSKSAAYYSIVLPDGSVVEPKIFRQNLTASANSGGFTRDTELKAPVKNLEVHGEIVFTYGFGKGLRSCGPYLPSHFWDGLARPINP